MSNALVTIFDHDAVTAELAHQVIAWLETLSCEVAWGTDSVELSQGLGSARSASNALRAARDSWSAAIS